MVKTEEWINTVSYTPLLRFSFLAPLLSEYFPDGVGISPATIRHSGSIRKRVGRGGKKDTAQQPADKKEGSAAEATKEGTAGERLSEAEREKKEGAQEDVGREGGREGEESAGEVKKKEGAAKTAADKNGGTLF